MEKGREKLPCIKKAQRWLLGPNFVKIEVANYALIDNYYTLEVFP